MKPQLDPPVESPGPPVAGRRRARVEGGRVHVHKVLLSAQEDVALRARAADRSITVPRLLVEAALFGDPASPTQRHDVTVELFALKREALAALAAAPPSGELRLALEQLAGRIERVIERLNP